MQRFSKQAAPNKIIIPIKQVVAVVDKIIKVPVGTTNTFRLARMFDVEAHVVLKKLQELCREPYTDEFQLLSQDAIETMALEFDKEIEFFEDKSLKLNI